MPFCALRMMGFSILAGRFCPLLIVASRLYKNTVFTDEHIYMLNCKPQLLICVYMTSVSRVTQSYAMRFRRGFNRPVARCPLGKVK